MTNTIVKKLWDRPNCRERAVATCPFLAVTCSPDIQSPSAAKLYLCPSLPLQWSHLENLKTNQLYLDGGRAAEKENHDHVTKSQTLEELIYSI